MSNKTPINWKEKITTFIKKIFGFGKLLLHLLSEFIHNSFSLTTYAIKILVEVLATADAVVFVAAILFGGVMLAAGYQWGQIGVWVAKALGFGGAIAGIGAATAGILAGIGFNVYQLFPTLWRLKRKVAIAYAKNNIDPKATDLKDGVQERLQNWHTFSHRTLKRGRRLSYFVETCIQIIFWATVLSLSVNGMLMLIVTLVLPEVTIAILSAACDLSTAIHEGQNQKSGSNSYSESGTQRRQAPTVDVAARHV